MRSILLVAVLMVTATSSSKSASVDIAKQIGQELHQHFPILIDIDIQMGNSIKTIWLTNLEAMLAMYDKYWRQVSLIYQSNSNLFTVEFVKCNRSLVQMEEADTLLEHDDIVKLVEADVNCTGYNGDKRLALKFSPKNSSPGVKINLHFELFYMDNDYVPAYKTFAGQQEQFGLNLNPLFQLSIDSSWKRLPKLRLEVDSSFEAVIQLCDNDFMSFGSAETGKLDILFTLEYYDEMNKFVHDNCEYNTSSNLTLSIRSQFDEHMDGTLKLYMVQPINQIEHTSNGLILGLLVGIGIMVIIVIVTVSIIHRKWKSRHEYNVHMIELKLRKSDVIFRSIDAF